MNSYKGQIQEQLEMFIIILGMLISITLFFFVVQKSKIETEKALLFEKWFDIVSITGNGMYYFYVPGTERPLVVSLSDLISYGSNGKVYYGWRYGEINVDKIMKNYLEEYLDDKWQFVTTKISYGDNLDCDNLIIYDMIIPLPSYSGDVIHAKIYKCI